MQTNHILSAPLIDIIFDGRNKDYGAYELRKKYNQRIKKALLLTGLIIALAFGSFLLANSSKKNENQYRISGAHDIIDLVDEKKPEKLPEPEKPKPQEPEVQTVQFTEPEIVEQPETPPPSTTELDLSKIDTETKEGKEDEGEVDPGSADMDGDKGIIDVKANRETGPAETVDIDAKYDGNWKKFLETNLNGEVPVNNGAPAGRYSVVIRFVVDTDGSISEITPLTAHGYGLEEEGVRVIRKAKKWEPAFLNGIHVKAYKKQVIVFEVMEE
ncbi:MAG: energy transducer TonB [Bacteroidota bacterium]